MPAFGKLDLGGTYRACEAADTWARLEPLLPSFGITRIADITGLDRIGIPVATCIRPNSRSLSVSQGKGATWELARVSAVMEAIELFHAEHMRPPTIVTSYGAARRRHAIVDPNTLPPGIRWSAYHPQNQTGWVQGHDLVRDEPILLPHVFLDLDCRAEHVRPDYGLFGSTSSGLAAGNDRWEAICHGLYEVVERDCEWRWRQLPRAAQQERLLDLDTIDSPLLRSYLDRFAQAKVGVHVWETTSRIGVPAYVCLIWDLEAWRPLGGAEGSGCHLSREVALSRAITEAALSRLTIISGGRDDVHPIYYEQRVANWVAGRRSLPESGTRDYGAGPASRLAPTFEGDARYVIDRLVNAGYRRVAIVEHTRQDAKIPVVHVVVPGLLNYRA